LYYNINGTQNNSIKSGLRDWTNNAKIAIGLGKQTDRFKDEKNTLEKAKKKHMVDSAIITAHSQGAWHGKNIASPNDKLITYNGFNFGKTSPNHTEYRTRGDAISLFNSHTQKVNENEPVSTHSEQKGTIKEKLKQELPKIISQKIKSHDLKHLQNKNISV
jgi:hypothetical protein